MKSLHEALNITHQTPEENQSLMLSFTKELL